MPISTDVSLCVVPYDVQPSGARLNECSGIMASRLHANVFWVHEDSDGTATPNRYLYAFNHSGVLQKCIYLTSSDTISVGQWEDCAYHASSNTMYVTNSGDNANTPTKTQFPVYAVPEPVSLTGSTTVANVAVSATYIVAWPGGAAYNCETMMVSPTGRLYFVNKAASSLTGLFAAPASLAAYPAVNTMTKVASWTRRGYITAGDWAQDGSRIAIQGGSDYIDFYDPSDFSFIETVAVQPIAKTSAGGPQESLCFLANGTQLLKHSEGQNAEVRLLTLSGSAPPPPDPDPGAQGFPWKGSSDLVTWKLYGVHANPATVAPPPSSSTNLCPNPSWEVDNSGWIAVGATDQSRSTLNGSKEGTACGMVISNVTGTATVNSVATLPAAPGETWSVGGWAKWSSGTARNFRCDVQFLDSTSAVLATTLGNSVATNTNTWVQSKAENSVAPASTAFVRIRFVFLSTVPTDVGLVDAFQLEQAASLPAYSE